MLCKLAGSGLSRGSAGGFASIPIHVTFVKADLYEMCYTAYKAGQLTAGLCSEAITASVYDKLTDIQTDALYCASCTFFVQITKCS